MQDGGVVLTAAHCVYAKETDATHIFAFAEEIWVIPAWDGDGNQNGDGLSATSTVLDHFGWAYSTEYIAGSAYVEDGDHDRDVAAIRLDRSNSRNVGMITGWYGWSTGFCSTLLTHFNYSYPSESCSNYSPLHTGRSMYLWSDQPDVCPNAQSNQYRLNTTGGCFGAAWGGMSGSGMYFLSGTNRLVSSVSSTSNRSTVADYCALWGQFTVELETLKATTRGSTLDLEAMRYHVSDDTIVVQQGSDIPAGSVLIANSTNNDPPPRSITLHVYLSLNPDISTNDTLLATYTYSNVDFGAMDSIIFNIPATTIPYGTTTQNLCSVGIIIDPSEDGNVNNNDTDLWDSQRVNVTRCTPAASPATASATDGGFCDRVRVTWSAVPGATSYSIYRNTVNLMTTSTLIGTDTTSPFDDVTAASGQTYYYWVRAQDICDLGDYAAAGTGARSVLLSSAPSLLIASDGASCTSISLSWSSVSGADTYQVWRNTVNSTSGASLLATGVLSPYVDSTPVAGVTYYYFVRGSNECGAGPMSSANTGFRQTAPAVVTGLTIPSSTCTGIQLQWNASNATNYTVYRNTLNSFGSAFAIGTVSGTSFLDTTAATGTLYHYWVTNNNACGTSGPSLVQRDARDGATSAPTGVSASDAIFCAPSIDVTWNPVANATTYQVWRATSNNTAFGALIATVGTTSFSDTTANPNTPYYYWVKAVNACSQASAYSTSDVGNRGGVPLAPTGVSVSDGLTCNSVSVSWIPAVGANGYQILRNTVNNPSTAFVMGNAASAPFIDATVLGSATYYYWVRSLSACGTGGTSASDTGFGGSILAISTHPADQTITEGQTVSFNVVAGGATDFLWLFNGNELQDGGAISGATTDRLTLSTTTAADAGSYSCVVSSPCGRTTTNAALLTINPQPCPADFNQDGGVDGADVSVFFEAWEAGEAAADVNFDGGVDGADVDAFFVVWEAGGC
jgi:fibronectin type 3 domain-containing protein